MDSAAATRAQLIAAIARLPTLERWTLSLRYPQDGDEEACSFREIAAIVKLPEADVKSIYWRAIDMVRPYVGDVRP